MKWCSRRDRYLLPAGRFAAPVVGRRTDGGAFMTGQEVLGPATETEALRQQLLQAQRLSSVGELASSVAHEFNNILTTIINSAKLGMKGPTPAAQAQAFEKILRGGQRASAIVNSMLGFARNHSSHREP